MVDEWLIGPTVVYGSVPFLNAIFKGTDAGIGSQLLKRLKPG